MGDVKSVDWDGHDVFMEVVVLVVWGYHFGFIPWEWGDVSWN